MAARPAARTLGPATVRMALLGIVLIGAWGLLGWRLFQVQVVQAEEFQAGGLDQRLESRTLAPDRGTIFDRNGDPLAMTVGAESIWVAPRQVEDPVFTAQSIAAVTGKYWETIHDAIVSGIANESQFVFAVRQVDPVVAQDVMDLGLSGVSTIPEARRVYPAGEVASFVVGMVDVDGNGIEGLEIAYEDVLAGIQGQMVFEEDQRGNIIPQATREVVPAVPGQDLVSTIDGSLQFAAHDACAATLERTGASQCWVVALHAETGDVLALTGGPGFDPVTRSGPDGEPFANFAVRGMYEPGSTQKLVTFAAALESGVIAPTTVIGAVDDVIETTDGACKRADDEIYGCYRDFTAHDTVDMTVKDIFSESSNVGTIRIQQMMGARTLYDFMEAFGYGQKTGLDFTGETPGRLSEDPGCTSCAASQAIGYNVAVSPLQMAAAFAAIANDGVWVEPRLVTSTVDVDGRAVPTPQERRTVTSEKTAWVLRQFLAEVVEVGTGQAAAVPGYRVGGKTGTSERLNPDGSYDENLTVASFVGMAPIDDPKVVVAVVVDSPAWEFRTGGSAAAPAFADVMEAALHSLGIGPDVGAG